MTALRVAHAIGTLLTGVAIALLLHGWMRVPLAILCFVCLALLAGAEALRVTATPAPRSDP